MNLFARSLLALAGFGLVSGLALTTVAKPNQVTGTPVEIFHKDQYVLSEIVSYAVAAPKSGDRVIFFAGSSEFIGIITDEKTVSGESLYVIYSGPNKPWNVQRSAIHAKVYYPFVSTEAVEKILTDKNNYPGTSFSALTPSPTSGTVPTPTPTRSAAATPTMKPANTPTPIPSFTAYIDGVAFVDENYNGVRESYEKGLMGKDINIYMMEPSVRLETRVITNDDGYYKATVHRAAQYQPQLGDLNMPYQYPVNALITISASGETKRRNFAMVPLGLHNPEVGGGGTIQGITFQDSNGNGVQDGAEAGIHFFKINLYNTSTNAQVATTTSGDDGSFTFSNLSLISYRIEAYNPTGQYTITKSTASVELSSSHTIDNSARIGVIKNY